jgi:DNA-binding response OmpR family regulator
MAKTVIAGAPSTGLRRSEEDPALSAGNVRVDIGRFQAFVDDRPVPLTYQEFELLRLLVGQPNRIIHYDELIEGLWQGTGVGSRRRLGVVVCRLRAKLSASRPYHIRTVRSRGYGLLA